MKMRQRFVPATIWNDKLSFRRFRYAWEKQREQQIVPKETISYIKEKNVSFDLPQNIFTSHKKEINLCSEKELELIEKPPCYMIRENFKPILHVQQMQVLTNCLVYRTLPSCVVVEESGEEEEALVRRIILYSHLLDNKKERLPSLLRDPEFTYIFGPGFRRINGIPMQRRIMTFSKGLLGVIARFKKAEDLRRMVVNPTVNVELINEDLFHMKLPQALLMTSSKPLPTVMNSEEVTKASEETLPSIYPLKPIIHRDIKRPTQYEDISNSCGVTDGHYPHTVFAHDNSVFFDDDPTEFEAFAMLHGFATAAAFARQRQGIKPGEDLKEPVTVNVVYTNGRHLQLGIHQLNTLNLTGPKKNVFWTQPWSRLFWNVDYLNAEPFVDQLDMTSYNVLKAMYNLKI